MATVYWVAVSGGRDSLATALHLRACGIPHERVFFDTGWEHADTYRYLREVLEPELGCIRWVSAEPESLEPDAEYDAQAIEAKLGHRSAFVRWVIKKGVFPFRTARWCTEKLKLDASAMVAREVIDRGDLPCMVVGVRAEESDARARLPERELDPRTDAMIWRPILRWTSAQVDAAIRDAGLPPNPLYLRGARRVGCWPCVFSGIADLSMLDDARVSVIADLEAACQRSAARRLACDVTTPRTMFRAVTRDRSGDRPHTPIRDMVAWARDRKGDADAQAMLPGLSDGCTRWGLCDAG